VPLKSIPVIVIEGRQKLTNSKAAYFSTIFSSVGEPKLFISSPASTFKTKVSAPTTALRYLFTRLSTEKVEFS
jgi:hypothetical protein